MFQKDLLQGKRILITGGGTGLGKAAAQRFLELGAEVYICGRRQEVLAATEQELRERTGGKIHSHPCDVRDAAAVEEMIAGIWAEGSARCAHEQRGGKFSGAHRRTFARRVSVGDWHCPDGHAAHHHGLRAALAGGRARRRRAERDHHLHDDGLGVCGAHRRWRRQACRR
jgi:NAD(P)-dependent dehydrogenase (short-subunit alcohol dehydrogenase family)